MDMDKKTVKKLITMSTRIKKNPIKLSQSLKDKTLITY